MERDPQVPSEDQSSGSGVPPLLASVAAYCWRLIVIGIVVYVVIKIIGILVIVVLPCAIALLLCALLFPVTRRLERWGLPPLAATWLTLLLAFAILGGIGTVAGVEASDKWPQLTHEVDKTAQQMQNWLTNGPLHIKASQLQKWVAEGLKYLQKQSGKVASTAVTAGTYAIEILAGTVFLFFVTFFLLKDGSRIWSWLISGSGRYHTRLDRAGRAAWETLSQYVHGTVVVATIHAIVMGTVLEILGVPLVVPLAVIIFLGSFIPIVGILVAGTLAVLVAFGTKGWVAAVIFLIALIIEQQLEGHVLQPMVVGRWVRLHPLAIILAIAIGGVVGGIPGAAVAVPIAAVVYRVWPALRGKDEITAAADPGAPPPAPPPSDSPEEPDGPDGPDGTARDDDAPVDDAREERTSDPAERNR